MSRRHGTWRRGLAAAAAAAAGLTTIIGQISFGMLPAAGGHHAVLPMAPLYALGFAGGFGLLVLAAGLWRGRRRAADVAIVSLCVIGAARLVYGLGVADAGIGLVAAALLWLNRGAFPRGAGRPVGPAALAGTALLAVAAALYATYAVTAIGAAHGTELDEAVAAAGRHLSHEAALTGVGSPAVLAINGLIAVIVVAGWGLLRALLRPAAGADGHLPSEHARAEAIVARHGIDSLDPFALREDKALHFAAGGFLAYRVLRETAVVSGDPVGPPGSAPAILASFARFCEERGWNLVLTAASGRHLAACEALGLRVLRIGDEAVVDPRSFTLEGRAIRKVRQSVTRIRRRGWRIEILDDREVSESLDRELSAVEADWRSRQPRLIGFAMTLGRLAGANERQGGIYVLARDPEGRLRSFLRFASYREGLSLDLMRRAHNEPNGLTEAQVVAAIEHARGLGMSNVSLNFAGFAHVMAADAALSRSQRLLRLVLRAFHGRFQLERLVRFNDKFMPEWRPRYLVYDGLTSLPLSALRVLQAEAYLPAPACQRMAGCWEARPRTAVAPEPPGPPPRRGLAGWSPWLRRPAAAAVIGLALTASSLAIGGSGAKARPVRIRAEVSRQDWSFVYRGPHGPTVEQSLYLPKGRPVILRIMHRRTARGHSSSAGTPRRVVTHVIRVGPTRRGRISLPRGSGHTPIPADVLGPKKFRAEVSASDTAGDNKGNPPA